jgi:hypothetical protein
MAGKILMYITEINSKMNWLEFCCDRVQWFVFVNTGTNFQAPTKTVKALTAGPCTLQLVVNRDVTKFRRSTSPRVQIITGVMWQVAPNSR